MQLLKLILFSIILLGIFTVSGYAQQAKLNWLADAKINLNGGLISVFDVEEFSDNSIVLVGEFERTADFDPGPDTLNLTAVSGYDIFIAKYTKAGKLIYAYSFGGLNNTKDDAAYAVAIDKQGNAYITGTFGKDIDFDPGPGKAVLSAPYTNQIFLVSYNANGKLRFAKNIAVNQASSEAVASGKSITVDDSLNVYITGTFAGKNVDFDPGTAQALFSAGGGPDIFFAKYNAYGNYVFNKVIAGSGPDNVSKIQLDHNANILICGSLKSDQNDFDPGLDTLQLPVRGNSDVFFAKYNPDGNLIFAHSVGGGRFENAESLSIASDNSFIVAGNFETKVDFDPGPQAHILNSKGTDDAFIARYDANGNYKYAFNIGSNTYDFCNDLVINNNDNYAVIGECYYGANIDFDPSPDSSFIIPGSIRSFFAEYSLDGNLITAKALYTETVNPTCLSVNDKGEFSFTGRHNGRLDTIVENDNSFLALYEIFVSTFNKEGKLINLFSTDGYEDYYNAYTNATSTVTDSKGNVYTCGYFNGRYDFDPGPGTYFIESNANYNWSGFFAKYNAKGDLLFAKVLTYNYGIHGIAVDKNENIYLTGETFGNCDFDPSDKEFYLPYKLYGYFIAKYDINGDFVYAKGENFNDIYTSSFQSISIDNESNICIGGFFADSTDFDPTSANKTIKATGNQDAFFAKYAPTGKLIFVKHIGSAKATCSVTNLKTDTKNNIVVTAKFYNGDIDIDPGSGSSIVQSKNSNFFISRYTRTGVFKNGFALQMVGDGYLTQEITAFTIDSSDNIYIAGNGAGRLDFDPGPDTAILLNGKSGNFFASYSGEGKFRYTKGFIPFGLGNSNSIGAIATNKNKDIFVAGSLYTGSLNVNPEGDAVILNNESYPNTNELFISVYDSSGNYLFSYDYDNDSIAKGNSFSGIIVPDNNHVIVAGGAGSKINFGVAGDTTFFEPTSLSSNIFIAKYFFSSILLKGKIPIAKTENVTPYITRFRTQKTD